MYYWAEYELRDGEVKIYSNVSMRYPTRESLLDYLATKVTRNGGKLYINVYENQILIQKLIAFEKQKGEEK